MSDTSNIVIIEQTLEEPSRFLIFTMDDALAFIIPVLVGYLSRHLIPGLLFGIMAYLAWSRIKGEGGINKIKGAFYWFLPAKVSPFRSFPPSAVMFWRG